VTQLLENILAAYAVGQARGPVAFVARGQSNLLGVRRLVTARGVYAVKLRTTLPDARAAAIERLAHLAGVAMPAPVYTHIGEAFLTVDPKVVPEAPAGAGRVFVRLHQWIDGRALDWGTVDARLSARVGALMAAVHRVAVPADLRQEACWQPPGEAGWRGLQAHACGAVVR
jgi:hypothetical protein